MQKFLTIVENPITVAPLWPRNVGFPAGYIKRAAAQIEMPAALLDVPAGYMIFSTYYSGKPA